MAETLTIRTASSTEVVKIAVPGPQGPKGDKGDPGDVAGLPLTTLGDTLYRGASQNERLPIGTSGQILKVSAGGIPEWGAAPATGVTSVALASSDLTITGSPITSSGTITANVTVNGLTLNKLETIQSAHFLGRHGSGAGDVQPVSATQARTILNVADGAEANVQSNWTEADSGSDAFILNKPSTFAPSAHSSSHASSGSDPLFDQDLNTTDSVAFDDLDVQSQLTVYGAVDFSPASSVLLPPILGSLSIQEQAGNINGTFRAEPDSLTANRTYDLPDASGTLALTSDIPANTIASTIVDAKGDLIVGTAADTVARLPVGATNGHVLTVDSAEAGGMKWAAASGGVSAVNSTLADILSVSGSDLVADDLGADKLYGFDDSEGKAIGFTIGSGLSVSGDTLSATATGTIGGSTGSTDNVILRSNGTGGSTLQQSGLIVEDVVRTFTTVTGDAAADTITITGSGFESGQRVRFTSLTGGSGLNTTTNYFVVNPSGDTFQVSTTLGGSPSLFTTNITAATLLTGASTFAHVALSQNTPDSVSSLVLRSKGGGATCRDSSGNARGTNAVDWQSSRVIDSQVASGVESFIAAGQRNTASGTQSFATNWENTASGAYAFACNENNTSSGGGTFVTGQFTTASGSYAASFGVRSLANRTAIQAYASGMFAAVGDAQRVRAVLRNKTTTNSAVELFMGTDTNVRLTVPSGKVMAMLINITGVKSDGSAVAHYVRQYAIKNVGGTTSEVYAAATVGTDNAASTSITLSANDTNDALKIEVTGIASETWRWVASVDAVEVAYGS